MSCVRRTPELCIQVSNDSPVQAYLQVITRVVRLGDKAKIGLPLAVVGALKFGFGAMLLFGLLFETPASALDDLRRLFDGNIVGPDVAKH